MQTPPFFPTFSLRERRQVQPNPFKQDDPSFFDTHPLSEILRSVFFSTVLWGGLAFTVYTVYTMVLGTH
jgi:hypothetical protein